MSLAKRLKMIVVCPQGIPSQTGGNSPQSLTQTATRDRTMQSRSRGIRQRGLLVLSTMLACLVLMLLAYDGKAFAQGINDESLVKQVVSNVNAYWSEKFQLLGASYTPAKLAFIHKKPVDGPCGYFSTWDGPVYCPEDETLYYPVYWRDDGQTLANYGASAVEWAVAHEIGHNVQEQMDELGIQRLDTIPLVLIELQADCLSGLYANQAIQQPEGIEAAIAAMGDAGSPEHGTSQQRIAAFELGYKTGDLSQCLALAN